MAFKIPGGIFPIEIATVVTELIEPCTLGSTMCNVLIVCIHVW